MILSCAHGNCGRPPDHHALTMSHMLTTTTFHSNIGKNFNRFSIFNDTPSYEIRDSMHSRNSSSLAHFVKTNQPKCPPIAVKTPLTQKKGWNIITNQRKPLRNIINTEYNDHNKNRLILMKLNNTDQVQSGNKKKVSTKSSNGSNEHFDNNVETSKKKNRIKFTKQKNYQGKVKSTQPCLPLPKMLTWSLLLQIAITAPRKPVTAQFLLMS